MTKTRLVRDDTLPSGSQQSFEVDTGVEVPLELEATTTEMSQLVLIQTDGQLADNMYVENHLGAKLFRIIEGTIFIPAQDTTPAIYVESIADSGHTFTVYGYGNVSINGGDVAKHTLAVLPGATPNAGKFMFLTEGWDSAYRVAITRNAYLMIDANAAPADAEVPTGGLCFWFDKTNGAAKLMLKGKSADGTVVTGEVALT